VFAFALERLGAIGPDEVIVVGNTPYDAQAAGKLNLRMIGLLCGGWTVNQLQQAGCIAIYRDPAELLESYDGAPISR
jgi:phosphoglycolate phosphatase-like HAD superfamily hydrolase